jgi:hypothetical protein
MGDRLHYDATAAGGLHERAPLYWGGAYVNDAAHDLIGRLMCPVSLVRPVSLPCCGSPR